MEVFARRPPSFLLAAVLVFFLVVLSPYPLDACAPQGEEPVPAASLLGGIDAHRCQLQAGGRRLLQRSAPPPPAPVSGPPIGPALPYTPPPPL